MTSHEKIIKKENGDKVSIKVRFWDNYGKANYDVFLTVCAKGKRLFKILKFEDDYEYRRLGLEDQKKYKHDKYLEHATEAEIMQAKLECWQLLKPSTGN